MGLFDFLKKNKPAEMETLAVSNVTEEMQPTTEERTLQELEQEYITMVKEYNQTYDSCAHEGFSYDEMLFRTQDLVRKIRTLNREIRLRKEPTITYKKMKGTRYTIEEFSDLSRNNALTDSDGKGYYAGKRGTSDIEILPSDVIEGMIRNDFTNVLWIPNK